MNHSDIAALMKGAAPAIRDLVAASVRPLLERIEELEQQIRERNDTDMIRMLVADAVSAIPPPLDGKDGADGPSGKDGIDGRDGVDGKDGLCGADGKDGLPGRDGDRGLDGSPGRDGIDGVPGRDGAEGMRGERGSEGPPGKLPITKAWVEGVHYEGDVVSRGGATYQALKDTAAGPPHEDWACIAAAGRDGNDGRTFTIRGTYAAGNTYQALDVVALNGGAFVAKTDDPGECPGAGWQLVASQGKTGKPGERGAPGRGDRGDAGLPVVAAAVNDQGLLTLVNGDGSTVDCDLYPLLSKIGGAP